MTPEAVREKLPEIAEILREAKGVAVLTHVQPDGDAIGSVLALGLLLEKMGKKVAMSWGEKIDIPRQYAWLPGAERVQEPGDIVQHDTVVAIDCATFQRLGELQAYARRAIHLINIDHHVGNDLFGTVNVVDEDLGSSSEVVLWLAHKLGTPIDKEIATCIYVGVVTDTGRFQYSNTTAETFEVARELIGYGLSPAEIFHHVYENISYPSMLLLGRVLANAQQNGIIVYSTISRRDLEETGASIGESENFIDFLRSVGNTEVAAILKESQDGTVKVSLRAKGKFDVAQLAQHLGGGGHRDAAGYTSPFSLKKSIKILLEHVNQKK